LTGAAKRTLSVAHKRAAVGRPTVTFVAGQPIVWVMRIGYVARGIVFLIVGAFALLAASGLGTHPQGARDALEFLFQKPFGGYFLWLLAAGLACFAGWRFVQAVGVTIQVPTLPLSSSSPSNARARASMQITVPEVSTMGG